MIDAFQFLWPAFLVAVCLVGIHAYFGIMVLVRKVIFVDLALTQIAALGATVAFMLGHPAQSIATYGYSLTFTLLGAEHLKQILTGNILTSGFNEIAFIVPLYVAIGTLHWLLRRHMTGAGSLFWEFLFYATFGIVVTSSVAIAGVL